MLRHACFSQVGRGACSAQRQRLTILPHGIGTSGRACLSRQISECRRSTKSERESAGWRHLRRNRPARWTRCGCSRIVGSSPSVLPISRVRTASGRPVRHGLLQPVMKGRYVAVSPDRGVGDSTARGMRRSGLLRRVSQRPLRRGMVPVIPIDVTRRADQDRPASARSLCRFAGASSSRT